MTTKRWLIVTALSFVVGFATCGWTILSHGERVGFFLATLGAQMVNASADPQVAMAETTEISAYGDARELAEPRHGKRR